MRRYDKIHPYSLTSHEKLLDEATTLYPNQTLKSLKPKPKKNKKKAEKPTASLLSGNVTVTPTRRKFRAENSCLSRVVSNLFFFVVVVIRIIISSCLIIIILSRVCQEWGASWKKMIVRI